MVAKAQKSHGARFGLYGGCSNGVPPIHFFQVKRTHLLTYFMVQVFEKLNVTQLVKKYPTFLWNLKVHHRVHTSPPLDPILSQLNPVRPINPDSIRSILMLSSRLRLGLPSGLLPSRLPTKTL
jgi:hypothetical protein